MSSASRFVDAHCHVWPLETREHPMRDGVDPTIREPRGYPIETHVSRLAALGVQATILVPHIAYYGRDIQYALDCRSRFPGICAVMGAITHDEVAVPGLLADDMERGVRAFRIRADDMAGDLDALCTNLQRRRGMLCPLIKHAQAQAGALDLVASLASRHPDLRIVLDHFAGTARPDELRRFETHENVFVKISDFGAFDAPPYMRARAATLALRDMFGSDRLMWGSNMPVFELDGVQDLAAAFAAVADATGLTKSEKAAILGGTADRLFFSD
jgi:predicted TIM-barrel fold metal-dependent hydrolase